MRVDPQHEDMNYTLSREKCVCATCISDYSLSEAIYYDELEEPCAFCGSSSGSRGKLSCVLKAMRSRFTEEWSESSAAWEAHLAGELDQEQLSDIEQDDAFTFAELLDFAEYRPANAKYLRAVTRAFGRHNRFFWRGYDDDLTPDHERHTSGWERFKDIVKHRRRFTFWSQGKPGNCQTLEDFLEIGAGEMLEELGKLAISAGMVKRVPKGTRYWRARVHNSSVRVRVPAGIFPPPLHLASQANRMSPAGIVMFYGAEHSLTAILETANLKSDASRRVTIGEFATRRELAMLDLFDLADLPSFFDESGQEEWNRLAFLLRFATELAKPIARDGRDHIEYAPTQAFTEFVRYQLRGAGIDQVDGIRYRSSKDGKPCVVLFCTAMQCGLQDNSSLSHWLSLDPSSVKSKLVRRAVANQSALKSIPRSVTRRAASRAN